MSFDHNLDQVEVGLDRRDLGFQLPFHQDVVELLRISNPNNDSIAFKVKTTAPHDYCVRPNSGRLQPGQDIQVQVIRQKLDAGKTLAQPSKDKFLVQAIPIKAQYDQEAVSQLWATAAEYSAAEAKAKKSGSAQVPSNPMPVSERKLRVFFIPEGSTGVNGAVHSDDVSSFTNSPTPAARTPQRNVETLATGPVSKPESRPYDAKDLGTIRSEAYNPATDQSSFGAAASNVASAVPTSADELKEQLAQAQAKISQLTQNAQDSGLRQRKADSTIQETKDRISSGVSGTQQTPATGIPVQIVAGLCLLCFLIAYFFF